METTESVKPFELIVGEANGEIHNADVPVRWCITPEHVKWMEEKGIEDPHVLIVTASRHQEFQRQLVPVTELMTYARFTKAGDMEIHAWLLDGKCGKKELHNDFIRKKKGRYATDIWYRAGEAFPEIEHNFDYVNYKIEIPEGVFGKEPSPWVKWFANMWHESRTVDQCHFRRRLILAFTLKWIPVLAWVLTCTAVRLAAAGIVSACGYWRNIGYPKRIFQPFMFDWDDAYTTHKMDFDNNPFIIKWNRKLKNRKYTYTHYLVSLLPVVPIFPIVIYGLCYFFEGSVGLFYASVVMGIFLSIVVAIDVISSSLMWFIDTDVFSTTFEKLFRPMLNTISPRWKTVNGFMSKESRWEKFGGGLLLLILGLCAFLLQEVWWVFASLIGISLLGIGGFVLLEKFMFPEVETDYTEIRELLCPKDEENVVANYEAIPKQQRTIRLWYLDIKNKVCKPMQG